MKIRPVGAELFHADGRADKRTVVTEIIVAFRNFAKAPRNCTGIAKQVTSILGVPLSLQPETYHRDRSYGVGEEEEC